MNYDRIILELMDRVAALEEEVSALKAKNCECDSEYDDNEQTKETFSNANSGRDTTKYMLDGVRYGKNRLVLAIVKKYADRYSNISSSMLMGAFDKSLQGSLGVVRTLQDAKKSYMDYQRRFFTQPHEIIHTSSEDCVVCSQWGAFNINNLIARAKELGIDVKEM